MAELTEQGEEQEMSRALQANGRASNTGTTYSTELWDSDWPLLQTPKFRNINRTAPDGEGGVEGADRAI